MKVGIAYFVALFAVSMGVARSATVVYQQGAVDPFTAAAYTGAEDLWIYNNLGGGTDDNTGSDTRVIVGNAEALGAGNQRHELMRFDVSSLTGQFSSINSVILRLSWAENNTGTGVIQMFPFATANAGWLENDGPSPPDFGGSTWSHRIYNTTPWAGSAGASTAGVDYVNTLLSSALYGASSIGDTFDLVFNDTSIINTWLTGTNAGLYLRTATEDNQAIFYSSEFGTASLRPQLIIEYNAVPEPSRVLLLAVGTSLAVLRRRRARA